MILGRSDVSFVGSARRNLLYHTFAVQKCGSKLRLSMLFGFLERASALASRLDVETILDWP